MFDVKPLAAPSKPPLTFDDDLENYILVVDPSLLPTTNFLSSTNAIALTDNKGRNMNIPIVHLPVLYYIAKGVDMLIDDGDGKGVGGPSDGDGGHRDGAAKAILKEGISMQRKTTKRPTIGVIDMGSNNLDDNCSIVFSIPKIAITQTGGNCDPLVQSVSNIVVKTKLVIMP